MQECNFEIVRRVLAKVNDLSPAQREIMCLCAVAYEAGKAAGMQKAE